VKTIATFAKATQRNTWLCYDIALSLLEQEDSQEIGIKNKRFWPDGTTTIL
jgi:hypothetical protein